MTVDIRTVGIVGAGQMGSGIAHVAALAGLNVVLNDVSEDRVNNGLATVNGNLKRQVSKGFITQAQNDEALSRIKAEPNVEGLGACDLVIEAATENEAVKVKIYGNVCRI